MERATKRTKEFKVNDGPFRRPGRNASVASLDPTAKTTDKLAAQAARRRSLYWKSLKTPAGRLLSTSKDETAGKARKGSTRSAATAAAPIVITEQEIEKRSTFYDILQKNLLLLAVLLSIVAGFTIGGLFNHEKFTERQMSLLRFPGELFTRVLRCLVIPLTMTSIISAVGGRPPAKSAWLALRTVAYFLLTTLAATLTGMLLTLLFKPGVGAKPLPYYPKHSAVVGIDAMLDIVRNILPDNFVEAFIYTTQSINPLVPNVTKKFDFDRPATGSGGGTASDEDPVKGRLMQANMPGLVVFALLVGFALSRVSLSPYLPGEGTDAATTAVTNEGVNMVLRLCRVLSDKFMRMADLALWYSPVGICFLIATDTMRFSDFSTVVWHLGQYAFTVFLGLGVHSFLVLPALYLTRVRRQACHFFFNLLYPLSIAFGVSGSSAAISVAMATLERRVGLDPATVRLVLPLGAIMNRDGTALYNMVTTLFCAQLQGATLNFTSLLVLLVACAFTSLSLLGIHPRFAATAHVSLLLSVIGLPSDNIGYIAMLHWLLDRACSSVNLMSDCVGAAVLQDPELFLPTSTLSTGRRLGSSSNVLAKRMQLLSPREPSPTPNLPGPFRASKATK